MEDRLLRRKRLQTLLELARVSRGWSRARLARSLGRDPTKLLPDSANPKLDYVVRLADVLEWPVGEVVDAIWRGTESAGSPGDTPAGADSFDEFNEQILAANRSGDHAKVVSLAQAMFESATTADHRAHACIREAAGWDGLGRYTKVLDAVQRGLRLRGVSVRLRLVLQATLANAQYTLWDLTPALGTAQVLADWYEANPPEKDFDWKRVAYVHYVRGHTRRRMMSMEPERLADHAAAAREDLTRSAEMHEQLAEQLEDDRLLGFANTCRGGLLEVDVEQGRRDPGDAVENMLDVLRQNDHLNGQATGDWVESLGWWCIFGSNIALRHLSGRELQRPLRELLDRALQIADRSDNWAMRERVYSIQFSLHQVLVDRTGLDLDFTIDDDERSMIGLTMGRFPSFRETGWQILETARVVRAAEGD